MIAIRISTLSEAATIGDVVSALTGLDQLDLRGWTVLLNCDSGSTDGAAGAPVSDCRDVGLPARCGGNTAGHIARPLMLAAFGAEVRQPLAGDFAFNRDFLTQALGWSCVPESASARPCAPGRSPSDRTCPALRSGLLVGDGPVNQAPSNATGVITA